MGTGKRGSTDASGEQQLRDAAQALADAAGQLGQSFVAAGGKQAENGVSKGLIAAAEALAQATAWVEQRSNPRGTRAQLLVQAAKLFAERGFAGVSLVDIAQAAGFTKGAVYSHFGSKEQVFLAAVRSVIERLEAAAAARGATGSEFSDAAGMLSRDELDAAAMLGVEAMLFGRRVPEHRAEVRGLTTELITALVWQAERGVSSRTSPPHELDGDEAQFALLALGALLDGIAEAEPEADPEAEPED